MVKRLAMLAVAWLLLANTALAANFSATVDRLEISEQDSFSLLLRYDAQVLMGSPDLSALEQDFRILGQSRSQQYRSVNGQTESFTQWTISLSPKRLGKLRIPAIEFKGQRSKPISLEVVPLSQEVRAKTAQDFFFEVSVEPKESLRVQEQVLYSEKLFYSQNHQNANLSELKVADARVVPLGEVKNYTTVINGRQFGVYERRYAIFPQASGELVIPGQRFIAMLANPYDMWSRGREVSAKSQIIRLPVLPIPENYPKDAPWLPVSALSLSDHFSRTDAWQAGEAVTRTLRIEAQGMLGNQLPAFTLPEVSGLRYYPDQPKNQDQINERGLSGSLEQSIAIVASENGSHILPEVRVPWWNTPTQKLEYATLPKRQIQVQGGIEPPSAPAPAPAPADAKASSEPEALPSAMPSWLVPLLIVLAVLLGLSLLANAVFLIKRSKAKQNTPQEDSQTLGEQSQRSAWKAFAKACQDNEPLRIRQSLVSWLNTGALASVTLPIASLSQFAAQCQDSALQNALKELDAALYSDKGNSAYNGQNLKALIEKLKEQKPMQKKEGLYPS